MVVFRIVEGPDCTRIGCTSDQHVGNHHRFAERKLDAGINRRCREHLDTLRLATKIMRREECRSHVMLGDLFDNEKPIPPIIAAVQTVITESDLPTFVIKGNHEVASMAIGDTSIAPLRPVATVLEEPTIVRFGWVAELWLVPFASRGPVLEWLPGMLREFEEASEITTRVLGLHMGIAWEETPPWLTRGHNWIDYRELDKLQSKHEIGLAISGDWHEFKKFSRAIQCGALVPTGFDNPGLHDYGSLLVIDLDKLPQPQAVQRIVVPGPRFIKAKSVATASMPEDDSAIYLEVTASSDDLIEETCRLEQLRSRGAILGGEVLPDKAAIETDAREAARSARAADSLEEATVAFVERMPLEAGVDRDRVLARVKEFLA